MSTEQKKFNLFDDSTIVAIATANGIGSISIVRISGAKLLKLLLKFLKKQLSTKTGNIILFI